MKNWSYVVIGKLLDSEVIKTYYTSFYNNKNTSNLVMTLNKIPCIGRAGNHSDEDQCRQSKIWDCPTKGLEKEDIRMEGIKILSPITYSLKRN